MFDFLNEENWKSAVYKAVSILPADIQQSVEVREESQFLMVLKFVNGPSLELDPEDTTEIHVRLWKSNEEYLKASIDAEDGMALVIALGSAVIQGTLESPVVSFGDGWGGLFLNGRNKNGELANALAHAILDRLTFCDSDVCESDDEGNYYRDNGSKVVIDYVETSLSEVFGDI